MQRLTAQFSLSAIAILSLSVSALAQSNLTAKANPVDSRPAATIVESDRTRDGLVGPVRRVRTAISKLSTENGRPVEGKQSVLETAAYDIRGTKVENQYFPVAGSTLTGKEVYKYDDKGNISEMTLVNDDGSLISKEIYKYEFDFAGNWNKMTTSVAVIEGGKMSFEPTEVTYRSIMYYLDEKMMKMTQPAPSGPPAAAPGNASVAIAEDKNQGGPKTSDTSDSKSRSLNSMPSRKAVSLDSNAASQLVSSRATSVDSSVRVDAEPPPPAPRPLLKPISGGVLNGTAISLPAPYYPDHARRLRMAGVVVVEVVVDETGKVISASATSGPGALREVAIQAALKARFSPTKLSGQPVKVSGIINYKFALAQ